MLSKKQIFSNEEIIAMLQQNNPAVWSHLYDKYAPAMYGMICSLAANRTVAEQIFEDAFHELKERQVLATVKFALYPALLRFIYAYAAEQLKQYGIPPHQSTPCKEAKLIHLFCTQCSSLAEASSILNIPEAEIKRKLHSEFLELRNKNEQQVQQQKNPAVLRNLDNQHIHLNLEKKLNEPKDMMNEKEPTAVGLGYNNKLINVDTKKQAGRQYRNHIQHKNKF